MNGPIRGFDTPDHEGGNIAVTNGHVTFVRVPEYDALIAGIESDGP